MGSSSTESLRVLLIKTGFFKNNKTLNIIEQTKRVREKLYDLFSILFLFLFQDKLAFFCKLFF